jgi:hypothetical protein
MNCLKLTRKKWLCSNKKNKLKELFLKNDWSNLIIFWGIFVSFLLLDIGIRYFSESLINFYSTCELAPLLFTLSYIISFIFIVFISPPENCLYFLWCRIHVFLVFYFSPSNPF